MANGGVQTVERALTVLEAIADHDGAITVSALAAAVDLPAPTTYRLLRSLLSQGYVRQLANRQYALGPRLIRIGEAAERSLTETSRDYLSRLVDLTEETANMAMLDGDMVVYVAQVPSRHSMRMFTEIGRRVLPHAAGVGKALLAAMADDEVAALLERTGMPASTSRTITTPETMFVELQKIRERGWAEDDGEQEIGVRCIAAAVPVPGTRIAVSVSGPSARVTAEAIPRLSPIVVDIAHSMRTLFEPSAD